MNDKLERHSAQREGGPCLTWRLTQKKASATHFLEVAFILAVKTNKLRSSLGGSKIWRSIVTRALIRRHTSIEKP